MKAIYNGIITSLVNYKENDLIVNLYTDEGVVVFNARGVRKLTNRNNSIIKLYAVVEVELDYKSETSNKYLSQGRIIYYPIEVYDNLKYATFLAFAFETINNLNINIYEEIKYFILNLKRLDLHLLMIYLLIKLLKDQGIGLCLDGCLKCNSSKIGLLSYSNGGFYCNNCLKDDKAIREYDYLKILYIMNKIDYQGLVNYQVENSFKRKIIFDLINYLTNLTGINYKCEEFLKMCF